jgi:putative phosphoesterase
MRIGIVSDTHGRRRTVELVQGLLRAEGAECVLHCGDIDDVDTVRLFRDLPTHFVFGNCDYDRTSLRQAMKEIGASLHESFGSLELDGRKIAWTHGDDWRRLQELEHSGAFDFVFYGHTHQAEEHRTGPTRVINPGALQRARVKTFVVLDLGSGELKSIVVE